MKCRRLVVGPLVALACGLFGVVAAARAADSLNMLVIMADDIGWMNVSSYGGDIMGVQTPHIDRIAREGIRFTSYYAQASCTAGRALARSLAYLERRAKDGKPFFLWHNSTRNHVFLHLEPESQGHSRAGREDSFGDALREHDGHVGQLLAELDEAGLAKNTIVVWTTDNGAYQYMWPMGGTTAGERGVVEKLEAGASYGGRSYKLHLDGFDQSALVTGQSEKSARDIVFYYDETVLTAVRFRQFKVTFSAKFGGRWDNPLQSLGRPLITNLLMDPFERQTGDVARQYAEHKIWVLTPILGVVQQHLATFKEFPIRQLGLSADVGKTIEGIQSQISRSRDN